VNFPAGVMYGERERSRRSHPHKVRRKSEVFRIDRHSLHRPVACEESGEHQTEDRDPAIHQAEPRCVLTSVEMIRVIRSETSSWGLLKSTPNSALLTHFTVA